jgi:hypothetical protein
MTDRDKGLCCAIKGLKLEDPGKVRHRTRIAMPEGMDLVLYCESKNSFMSAPEATALRKKGVRKSGCWSAG